MDADAFYHLVTSRAEQAILRLTAESRGNLDEDNQSHWDTANGVMLLWRDLAGVSVQEQDVARLELLLEDMPGVDNDGGPPDDPGTGDWHLTPVVYLP